jgi:GNAT superfamily N-acetyltransferase
MPPTFEIRAALAEEAPALSKITLAAKAHWNYPSEWMQAWQRSLTIHSNDIEQSDCYVAVVDRALVGFYLLKTELPRLARLEHLWVLPKWMGQGIGRELFLHALAQAKRRGAAGITIESDPHAEGFYLGMGAIRSGLSETVVLGQPRELPVLTFELGATASSC